MSVTTAAVTATVGFLASCCAKLGFYWQPRIGKPTWAGEIWLSFDNALADRGLASAAEFGVYGPDDKWLIEATLSIPTW